MATPVVARYRDTGAEAGNRRWVILLGIMSMAAAAILMFVGASLGTLYAAVLVLGVLAVVVMIVAPIFGIVVFIGTLLLGLPAFLAGDGRLTANNLLGLVLRRRPHDPGVLEPRPLVHQDAPGHPVRPDRLRPRRVTHARPARVHPAGATAEGLHREHAVHLREPPGLPLHVRQFRPEQEARAARPARRPRVHHGGDPVGLQQPGQLQGRRGHRHRQDDRHGHREGDGVPGAVGYDLLGQEREPAGLHVQRQHPADLDVHPDRAQPGGSRHRASG